MEVIQSEYHHGVQGMSKKDEKMAKIREELGIKAPVMKKERKKRKPMTAAQKEKAKENLAKARAAKGPAKSSGIHPKVEALDDDHPLSAVRVKEWLKYNQDLLKAIKPQEDSKDWKERREYRIVENYVKNLRVYLKDSVWCDHRYGKLMENKMEYVTIAHAGGEQWQNSW